MWLCLVYTMLFNLGNIENSAGRAGYGRVYAESIMENNEHNNGERSTQLLHEHALLYLPGQSMACIVPAGNKTASVTTLAAFGMWKNDKETHEVETYVRGMRKGRSF